MPRPLPVAEIAMEVQAEILDAQDEVSDAQADAAPLWNAARKSPALMAHCRRLAEALLLSRKALRLSRKEAREITAMAEAEAA